MFWLNPLARARSVFGRPESPPEAAKPVLANINLAITENGHVRLCILSTSPLDKLTRSARMDQADTEVSRMIDPWWVAGLHFDNMLKKREQLVQTLREHEAEMASKVHFCETEVLPQRGVPIPAWAAPTLQQALVGYQNSTTAKLGQMKEALVDPAVKKSQAELASITCELSRELEKAEQLIVTTKSRLANEQACSQSLAMALLEARAINEEQLAKVTAQLAAQTERACGAEALADIKAGLLADECALSSSLAQDKRALKKSLTRQESRHVASIIQLGDEVTFFTRELATLQARHQEVVAAATVTSSERQLLQNAQSKSDQAVLALQKQLKQEADNSRAIAKGSLASDIPTSPGSTARGLAARINTQIPSGPGSPDDSCQSSWSDHHRPDLASDEDETGNTGQSLSGDDYQEGALSSFLPAVIPARPNVLELQDSDIQVAQLASHQWHHRLLAILEYYHIPWKGSWDLAPFVFAPGVFALVAQSLSFIGQGSFGRVHFGQMWVGQGSPDSPQLGWAKGWEPVAIKITRNTDHARREVAALQKVQQTSKRLPGRRHVIQLLESYTNTTQPTGVSRMYIVTRYEEGYDLDESFRWLRDEWSEQEGSDREEGRAQWLSAIKEATRQALQGLDVIHGCGLVHGDIKPNNFRLAMKPDGSQVHLVITDLGNCCAAGSDHTCIAGSAVYTSPEGLDYFHKPQEYLIQGAADMFSMGCVLFQLLTDLHAFMRPEDQFGEELTIHDLHQLALWRQAKWDTDSSQGRPLPYGLDALKDAVPDAEDCRQAVDLLQHMLKMEPSHRPSVEEALSHPFLKV